MIVGIDVGVGHSYTVATARPLPQIKIEFKGESLQEAKSWSDTYRGILEQAYKPSVLERGLHEFLRLSEQNWLQLPAYEAMKLLAAWTRYQIAIRAAGFNIPRKAESEWSLSLEMFYEALKNR